MYELLINIHCNEIVYLTKYLIFAEITNKNKIRLINSTTL
jgi:hypothetical protein